MSSTDPLIPRDEGSFGSYAKEGCRRCCLGFGVCFGIIFALAWAVQGVMYYWATTLSGCRAAELQGYTYPDSGASVEDPNVTSYYNVLPQISLLAERDPTWYGSAFDVIPSNEASSIASAPTGAWWRTWGPIFYTYTFEDVANSRTTLYMRRNLLRVGQSHRIERCDGKGPRVTFTEGANYFANRLRQMLGMNQGTSFKIYLDNEFVGVAEETSHGFQSLTFREKESGKHIGSSILSARNFHGHYDLWLVKNSFEETMPYYVSSAATLLFAYHTLNVDTRSLRTKSGASIAASPTPAFIAEEAATETSVDSEVAPSEEFTAADAVAKVAPAEELTADAVAKVEETASAPIEQHV